MWPFDRKKQAPGGPRVGASDLGQARNRSDERVRELESRLGFRLPEDYRQFLVVHEDSLLDDPLVFKAPRSGIVDELLTVDQILANDENEQIGIPEKSLMHIGGNLMGGYLYLKVSEEAFGEVHYMEEHESREQFPSFTAFLDGTERQEA